MNSPIRDAKNSFAEDRGSDIHQECHPLPQPQHRGKCYGLSCHSKIGIRQQQENVVLLPDAIVEMH